MPWAHAGEVVFRFLATSDTWVRNLPDWEEHTMEYALYLVPRDDYMPLREHGVRKPRELDTMDIATTPERVAEVRVVIMSR